MSERFRFPPPELEPRPLPKVRDMVYPYRGYWDDDGLCRIRLFAADGRTPVIVASELPENRSTSVTNMAEYLAAEIGAAMLPGRFEETDPFTWIEEYPPPTAGSLAPVFSRIVFASYSPRIVSLGGVERTRLGRPQWQPIGQREVAALIGNGETFPTARLPRHARRDGP
jgi:hypothetical protein